MNNNPLLQEFNTPYQATPFNNLETNHFKEAFPILIEQAKKEIDEIASNADAPTFENTIEALEFAGEKLGRASEIFFNLNSAETSDEIQLLAQDISPQLTQYANDIILNDALFKRVKTVYQQKDNLLLNTEAQKLLEQTYIRFTRNGSNLNETERKKLREIDQTLAKQSLNFGENVLKETNEFILHIENEKELAGLPKSIKDAAQEEAKERNLSGWVFTLQYPSYVPFMTYAANRALRQKLYFAFGSRGFNQNSFNNEKNILEIVKLRKERAQLLGYKNHAQYTVEQRMAQSEHQVQEFLNTLLNKALPAANTDIEQVKEKAKEDGINQLERWDFAYYAEKLKQERFEINDELLKPYFQLERVIEGVFKTAQKLFGLSFKIRTDVDGYHPDVTVYEVVDKNKIHVALFYADFFPRKGKRAGAWMTSYRSQHIKNGVEYRPHVSIVCNFSKPQKDTPSLLTFNEVTTLFHEFGHALHGMLAKGTYPSLTGTNVYWDFVELPSQILENWCYQKECLELFASHYKTNETIPSELINKIIAAAQFMEGNQTVRQISFGLLDMGWHSIENEIPSSVAAFEEECMAQTNLMPPVKGTNMSTAFSHIFQGGYSAGYYSYKWAEVLDADAFELFKEKGVFNADVAKSFKENILEKGGTEHPMELYKKFRGRKPDVNALLRRAGLIA